MQSTNSKYVILYLATRHIISFPLYSVQMHGPAHIKADYKLFIIGYSGKSHSKLSLSFRKNEIRRLNF